MSSDQGSNEPIPFTGVLITFNEAKFLDDCLARLTFCNDLLVVDLGSQDNSVAIAETYGARVVPHDWVPYASLVRGFAISQATTEWVVSLDPDMMLPPDTHRVASRMISSDDRVALITVPFQNYLGNQPLRYGSWGGISFGFPTFVHKDRVEAVIGVHRGGLRPKQGYSSRTIEDPLDHVITHRWASSISDVAGKQRRYVSHDVESRYERGITSTKWTRVYKPLRAFVGGLIRRKGFLHGWTGLALSREMASYERRVQSALYEKQRGAN